MASMEQAATKFQFPNCGAEYKLVRFEADPAFNQQLTCLSCGGPLPNRDGKFALKYFRIEKSSVRELRGRKH